MSHSNLKILKNPTDLERNVDFLKDLLGFIKERKKIWLLPIILALLLFGGLIMITGGTAIAPFIYTLF